MTAGNPLGQPLGWTLFGVIFVGAFVMMMLNFNRDSTAEAAILDEALELAPVELIDELMMSYETQGYLVIHILDLSPDPENSNRALIEYTVSQPSTGETWTYSWAWEVPIALTGEVSRGMPSHVFQGLLDECRLVPLSDPAKGIAVGDYYDPSEQ